MTAPDARPERVWVDDTGTDWGWYPEDPMIRGYSSYVPESRLREVEAEREALKLQVQFAHELADDKVEAMREQLAALRAELTQRERAAFEAGVELRDNFGRRPTSQEVGAAFAAHLKTREEGA